MCVRGKKGRMCLGRRKKGKRYGEGERGSHEVPLRLWTAARGCETGIGEREKERGNLMRRGKRWRDEKRRKEKKEKKQKSVVCQSLCSVVH